MFWTSPSIDIEAIVGLISINLHLQKLGERLQLCTQSLLPNHIIRLLLESNYSLHLENHHLSLETLTVKQWLKVKSSIVNANNRLNRLFNSFDPFNNELSPGNRLIDLYSSCFSFHHLDRKSSNTRKTHLCHLIPKQPLLYQTQVSKIKSPHLSLMYILIIPLLSKSSTML